MQSLRVGIDVSHWNHVDWSVLREHADFVLIRATFGTKHDRLVKEHVRNARREAFSIGLYAFPRQHLPIADQFAAFVDVADAVHYGPGDIIPSVDIERDPFAPEGFREVTPAWSGPAQEFSDMLADKFSNAQTYITRRDWAALGRPTWILSRPIWCAHWGVSEPATPGGADWHVWQRRVAAMPGSLGKPIDQNVAKHLVLIPESAPLGLTPGQAERHMGRVALAAQNTYESTLRSRHE